MALSLLNYSTSRIGAEKASFVISILFSLIFRHVYFAAVSKKKTFIILNLRTVTLHGLVNNCVNRKLYYSCDPVAVLLKCHVEDSLFYPFSQGRQDRNITNENHKVTHL